LSESGLAGFTGLKNNCNYSALLAPIPSPFPIRGKGEKRLLCKRFKSPPHLWGRVWVGAKMQKPIWKELGLNTTE